MRDKNVRRGSEQDLNIEDIDLNEDVDAQEDEAYPIETEPDGYDVATGEPVYDLSLIHI